jgi:hypothetical protein
MAIWNNLWSFGIFYRVDSTFSVYLVHFSGFGIMYQEKSGNPVLHLNSCQEVCYNVAAGANA